MIKSPIAHCAALALVASLSLLATGCSKHEDASTGAPSGASPTNPPPAAAVSSSAASGPTAAASSPTATASATPSTQDIEKAVAAAKPLASSTASDAKLESVLTGGNNWRSAKQGGAANDEYVGFELPEGQALQPHELTIRWVAWHWVPHSVAIDDSDDGKTWATAATVTPKEPSDVKSRMNGMNRWDETFSIPASAGAHRFWRVRAADMPEANFFGLERITAR
jgi:hypothetical protein